MQGELDHVRWMQNNGKTSQAKAAASMRILALEKELEDYREANKESDEKSSHVKQLVTQ